MMRDSGFSAPEAALSAPEAPRVDRTDSPYQRSIASLFEEIVAERPGAVALLHETGSVTYDELNRRANQLARFLQASGVKPDDPVAISLDRSPEFIVGVLGILKAGGAYVPLDATYPAARLEYMLEDTQPTFLLTQSSFGAAFATYKGSTLKLDTEWDRTASLSTENPPDAATGESVAYIMYTSGSTGKPKGVMVPHRGIIRLVRDTDYADYDEHQTMLQLASISFDASTFEIWGALLNGGRLAILPPGPVGPQTIGDAVKRYDVTIMLLTAGMFDVVASECIEILRPLKQLLAGGDVLSQANCRRVVEELPNLRLVNAYGPTENSVITCCHQVSRDGVGDGSVPIGRPIPGTRVYLLDDQGMPTPVGEAGELYAAGDGLALGYWNSPELTEQRFVQNPYVPEERLYRTGDLARYTPDGLIEFLGRADCQVKIRGYRIELGEIEDALRQQPGIQNCVVVARALEESVADKQLVAYYVCEDGQCVDQETLRASLQNSLPEFMAPACYVKLDHIPLSPSGKVDRKALPDPARKPTAPHLQPSGERERKIAALWKDVLGVPDVGVDENFFEIGGTSLLITRLHLRMEQAFGIKLLITDLFQYPTVRSQASLLAPTKDVRPKGIQDRAAKQQAQWARLRAGSHRSPAGRSTR